MLEKLLKSLGPKKAAELQALLDEGMSLDAAGKQLGIIDPLIDTGSNTADVISSNVGTASDIVSDLIKDSSSKGPGERNKSIDQLLADSQKTSNTAGSVANIVSATAGGATAGPAGAVAAGLLATAGEVVKANKTDAEAAKAKAELVQEGVNAETKGDTLSTIGKALGGAQVIGGLVQGQSIDIPEFNASQGIKKATDMLLEANEQGIDPAIVSAGKRDIEARRRSMLYKSQGESGGAGERFNKDVVANLLANEADKDLGIAVSREKDMKLSPAADALMASDELKFRKTMAKREGAYAEATAAGDIIGSGIDNIIGSLMLGEQLKSENERKKYE